MANAALSINHTESMEAEGQGRKPLRSAIIFVKRNVLKSVVSLELRKHGVAGIHSADSAAQATRLLKKLPDALLVVDWDQGEKATIKVLQAAQGKNKVDTRPIYFTASQLTSKLVSIATDYNIVQVHIGQITPKDIQAELQIITSFGYQSKKCQEVFHEVARLRELGNWKQAEGPLRELLTLEPGNIRAGLELAENLFETGDFDDAADCVQEMLVIDPENLRAQHLNARIMLKRGDHDQAFALLDGLCEGGVLNHDRMIDLGNCLVDMGRLDAATQQFEAALDLNNNSQQALLGKGQCELLKGNINEAVLFMRQLTSEKEVAAVFNNSAIHCMRRKQFEKGIDLYKSAIAQLGKNPTIRARIAFNIGIGYLRWGKRREACIAFAHSAELDPDFTKARYNMQLLSGGAESTQIVEQDRSSVAEQSPIEALGKAAIQPAYIGPEQGQHPSKSEASQPKTHSKGSEGLGLAMSGDLEGFGEGEDADSFFDDIDDSYFQSLIED